MSTHRVVLTAIVVAYLLGSGQVASANLITNGGFENPQIAKKSQPNAYGAFPAATDWTASAEGLNSQGMTLFSSFDQTYFPTYWAVSGAGTQAALFNEFGGALDTLSQTFATTPGATYNVTFDLASERGGPTSGSAIDFVAFAAGTTMHFATPFGTPFVMETFSFTAAAGATTLEFSSTGQSGGNAFSPILDNVKVENAAGAVPEPTSFLLWVMGAVGLFGARWRHREELPTTARDRLKDRNRRLS